MSPGATKSGRAVLCALLLAAATGCSSAPTTPGGATGSGGAPGNPTGSGGTSGSGGSAPDAAPAGSGGASGSGGNLGSGGTTGPTGTGGAPASPDGGGADVTTVGGGWPPVSDFAAPGPFALQHETNTGPAGGYDIVRPAQLGAGGRKHPIISWNNGTLYAIDKYQPLLDHLASYGFVVIGAHTNTTAGGGVHKAAIDWLRARNTDAQSPYRDMLDLTHIGASGHSQGGGATLAAAANKPGPTGITAALPLMPILSFETDTSILAKQTAPLLIISATMDDRSMTSANQTFAVITSPFVNAEFKGVHEDAMNAAMHAPALAWFRFQLMGDTDAGKAFFFPPSTCGLCKDPAWQMVRYKNTP